MKQTAVDFLQDKLSQILDWDLLKLFEQAKEMEKQQIKDAFNQGYRDGEEDAKDTDVSTIDISKFGNAQTYFDETFEQ